MDRQVATSEYVVTKKKAKVTDKFESDPQS
jgi:hypothetical protein